MMSISVRNRFILKVLIGFLVATGCLFPIAGCEGPLNNRKPNVLILNLSNLRKDVAFSGFFKRDNLSILNFTKSAQKFTGGTTSHPFENFEKHFDFLTPEIVEELGYRAEGKGRSVGHYKHLDISPERFPAPYALPVDPFTVEYGVEYIKKVLKTEHDRPFILASDFLYLIPPYLSRKRANSGEFPNALKKMTVDPRKLPRSLLSPTWMLFPQRWLAEKAFPFDENSSLNKFVTEELRTHYAIKNYQEIHTLENRVSWQKRETFDKEVRSGRALYRAKIKALDKMLSSLFTLLNDPKIRKSTVVILTSDHGTSLMEQGHLLFGSSVYQQEVEFPMWILWPDSFTPNTIYDLFDQGSIKDIVLKIMKGDLNSKNIESLFSKEFAKKQVFSYNCQRTQFSLVTSRKMKIIYNNNNQTYELYNLTNDPEEQENLAEKRPDLFYAHKERLLRASISQQYDLVKDCLLPQVIYFPRASVTKPLPKGLSE